MKQKGNLFPDLVLIERIGLHNFVPCVLHTAKIATVPIGATGSLGFLDVETRQQVGPLEFGKPKVQSDQISIE